MRDHRRHRRVGAVGGAEGVVDVNVGEFGERLCEGGVVLFFLCVLGAGRRPLSPSRQLVPNRQEQQPGAADDER